MSHALFFKNSICDSCVTHTYATCIFYDSEFCGDFSGSKNFSNPPTQNLNFAFSLDCVGVISFLFHDRIEHKIWHRIICIGPEWDLIHPLSNKKIVYAHAIVLCNFKRPVSGFIVCRRCHYPRKVPNIMSTAMVRSIINYFL